MFAPVYAAFISAFIFYVLIPVIGAFIVRASWRAFRRSVIWSASLPGIALSWDALNRDECATVRIEGELEALGQGDELWLRADGVSIRMRMEGAAVYLMSGHEYAGGQGHTFGSIERMRWKNINAVQPGQKVYAAGRLRLNEGQLYLDAGAAHSLVMLHDGSCGDTPLEAIRNGRHSNEYWNPLTQASLAIGILVSAGLASTSLNSGAPALLSALIISAAFSPLLPLLPPGLLGFLLYRSYWERARYYRSRRDLADYSAQDGRMALGWKLQARIATLISAAGFLAALALNAWLSVALLRSVL
ncbi:MAG TPA: hypothetical protein DCG47_06960 [Spirochaetaceae bacterium]|jgi:hypothetical protein|nr:hypothetical protein [Spirochaetaceae bacterium]